MPSDPIVPVPDEVLLYAIEAVEPERLDALEVAREVLALRAWVREAVAAAADEGWPALDADVRARGSALLPPPA